jgi:sterol desaturase/sphingolipid hydroxylase (fatty acid hydroxylase superfamily)
MSSNGPLAKIRHELELPRDQRPIGSGWLSGAGALLAALTGLFLVITLRHPGLMNTPELDVLRQWSGFRITVHAVLAIAYILSLLSLVLRREKAMGFTALGLTTLAALLGGAQASPQTPDDTPLYFGLDFFVLNVLFTGFLFLPLERIWPNRGEQTVFRPEWQEDLFYYLVSSMFVQVLTFLTAAPSNVAVTTLDLASLRSLIASQPFVLQLVEIMFITDLAQYWLHRAFHTVPFLWRFHAVHHSAQHMDWLAGARMHFLEIVALRSVTAFPMLTLGFDPGAVQAYVLIVYITSSFIHANVGWNFGALERYLVTPRFHHWHHGIEREAVDVNFAIHFPLFDRLFGTYHLPDGAWPRGYGIEGHPVPQGYWKQFLYPFRRS